MSARKMIPVEVMTPETKCGFWTNTQCCTYISQEIDVPRSKHDFDFLLWQISHRDIGIYKDEGSWYLLVNNACNHIMPDGRCGIYADRPQICRDYSNDYCEFDEPAEDSFELYFQNYDELLAYCKKRFKRWGQRPY
jgi:uncharacterized protein